MLVDNDTKIYAGDDKIIKAYQGDTIIYEQSSIPYTQVQYLQSDGSQSIPTGITLQNNKLRCVCKVMTTGTGYSHDGFLLSGYSGWTYGIGDMYGDSEKYKWTFYFGSNSMNTNLPFDDFVDYELDYTFTASTYSVTSNGTTETGNKSQSYYPNYTQLYVFSRGNDYSYGVKAKIYYMQIYVDDELVRDFVPVLDDNDVACFYDKVSQTLFYSSRGNNFIYE